MAAPTAPKYSTHLQATMKFQIRKKKQERLEKVDLASRKWNDIDTDCTRANHENKIQAEYSRVDY